ncbi:sterol desaturase family protein [Parasphingorhabdus halotolerans]|uniref:Sterol desaturase family protein n=1 Tax=Parasphingorhabdus halotolerans TaxID=2725558 RepID=A0A6H2DQ84_9SPHN|nr:sterol desaturase family protein [Parasphingorhabdus halotolerans]QJB69921.1 sterol desaturase family protein [Parasphingorhabdus halotolerans]
MEIASSMSAVGIILTSIIILSLVEALIPLRRRSDWSKRHLAPNLVMTFLTFATNLIFNIPFLFGLVWLQSRGWGLFNAVTLPTAITLLGTVIILDFAWYLTHVSMHKIPSFWRVHAVHHSDPIVDVTTTVRQHPLEGVIRYLFLAAFAFSFGVPPAGFAIYRIWSVLYGQFEHANIRLPQWLDTAITFIAASPNMHKIHHSANQRYTDTNYSSILNWDRLFGTFVPSKFGTDVRYGLDGYYTEKQQSVAGMLVLPFHKNLSNNLMGEHNEDEQ